MDLEMQTMSMVIRSLRGAFSFIKPREVALNY